MKIVNFLFLRCLYQGTSAAVGNCSGGGGGRLGGLDVSDLVDKDGLYAGYCGRIPIPWVGIGIVLVAVKKCLYPILGQYQMFALK